MDRQRLAAALAYEEERRRRMRESVPVIDDSAPTTQPRRSLRSDLENLSSGLGQAGVNILEGGKALLTDPIGTVKGTYETVKGVVRDPSLIADALRYTADKAMSGPLGAGEVIGEMVNPIRFRRTPVMQEIDVYRGAETADLKPRDFPGVFVSKNRDIAQQYGQVHKFDLDDTAKILPLESSKTQNLVQEFFEKHPEAMDFLNDPDDPVELFMFPTEEWASFLAKKGYDGTSIGDDIFVGNLKKLTGAPK